MQEPAAGLSASIGRRVLSARGAFVLWAVLLVLLWALRAFLFPATGADDAEQLVHSQDWAWGYGPRNPPLFTWLVILSQQVFGVTVAAVVFVKFALLGGALLLLYRIARRMLGDERLAALAVLAPLGFYYVAWDTVFNFTHTAMLAFSVCLTVHAFLGLADRADWRRYLLFGAAMGIGALAKYNYLIFLSAFLAAALTGQTLRRAALDRRMILAIAAFSAIVAPHAVWLWRQRTMLETMARDRFTPNAETTHLTAALSGIWETGLGAVSFLLPLLIFLAILFPRAFTRAGSGTPIEDPYHRLLVRTFLIAVGATLLGVAVIGIERVRPHYMFPLILFPVYFFARANAAGLSARAANRFAVLIVALAVIVPAGVVVKYAVDPLRGSKSYLHMPYAAFAGQLRAAGFRRGTILGDWLTYPVAGNLRVHFPDSQVINMLDWEFLARAKSATPLFPPRADARNGQCLIVWSPQATDWRDRFMRDAAKSLLGADFPAGQAPRRLSADMPNGGGRVATLLYLLAPEGTGNCR
jgi:4-amino-4-deoxy-L-arabinose transferase-like glycosyltransferase